MHTESPPDFLSLIEDKEKFLAANRTQIHDDHLPEYDEDLDIISITTDQPIPSNINHSNNLNKTKMQITNDDGIFGSVLSFLFNEGEFPTPPPNYTIYPPTIPPFKSLPKIPEIFDDEELISITTGEPELLTQTLSHKQKPTSHVPIIKISTTEKILPVYSFTNSKIPKVPNTVHTAPNIENINLLFPHQFTSTPDSNSYKIIKDNLKDNESSTDNNNKIYKTQSDSAEILTKSSNSITGGVGLLKLAGCNVYGRMYRIGKIISELSEPCLECKCTEIGVHCTPLSNC